MFTTGMLQQAVYLHHQPVGRRAVVVGAEHVSYSALLTLRHAGVEVVALVTDQPGHQTWPAFHAAARLRYRVPVLTGVRVTNLLGGRRIEGVEISGSVGPPDVRQVIGCDTVVFTGDWVPDHELARRGGLTMDPGTRGPAVDAAFRTAAPGVFAIGNLVHPVLTADTCVLDGRHVVPAVQSYLDQHPAPGPAPGPGPARPPAVPVRVVAPLAWVSPNLVGPAAVRRFTLWANAFASLPRFIADQDGRHLADLPGPRTMVANRPFTLDGRWTSDADPSRRPDHDPPGRAGARLTRFSRPAPSQAAPTPAPRP